MSSLWSDLAARANVSLNDAQVQSLHRYLDLLLAANQRMNLTRIVDRAAAEVQHVGDALTLLPHLPPGAHSLADVGSGGGSPGIPLAIVRPDAEVVLIESTRKKAVFLQETVVALGLANVMVLDQRAEDVGQSERRETFDIVVARAVAALAWLAEWCLPLAAPKGKVLAMKGERVAEELPAAATAIRLLRGGQPKVHPVELPGATHRVIVEIAKTGRCDARYPRPATAAKGNPLG